MAADWILAGEEALHERLVHHRYGEWPWLGTRLDAIVMLVELPAEEHRHAHRPEEARADGVAHRCRVVLLRVIALDRHIHSPAVPFQDADECGRGGGHTGGVLETCLRRFREVVSASRVVPAAGQVDAERQEMRRTESGVHGKQVVHAPDEQPGADEQQERQRHLHDDERIAKPRLLARDRASSAAQRRGDVDACASQCRHAAGQHCRDHREAAAEEGNAQVRIRRDRHRRLRAVVVVQQCRRSPAGKQQPERRTDGRRGRGSRPAAAGRAASGDAPTASRSASSRCRAAPRAISRFATLAQTISSTPAATVIRIRSGSVTLCRSPECP